MKHTLIFYAKRMSDSSRSDNHLQCSIDKALFHSLFLVNRSRMHKARMALHATFFGTNFVKGAHLDKVYSMVYQTLLVKHVLEQKIKDGKFQKSNTKILLIHNHITSNFNMKKTIS